MLKLEKRQVKIISIAIALVFIGSVVALALTSTGAGIASAAGSGAVGVIDSNQVMSQHPDVQKIEQQMSAFTAEVKKDFDEKTPGMSDQEKQDYYLNCQQRLQQKQQELIDPLIKSIDAAVKKVADAKGLNVVVEKSVVIYGGVDITRDVVSRLGKK